MFLINISDTESAVETVLGPNTSCWLRAAVKWPPAYKAGWICSPDPVLTRDQASSRFTRSTLRRRVIDASWPFMIYTGKHPVSRLLASLFTDDETIKTGSHISSQRLYVFEKLRLSGGDGWGLKVTAVFYDCYWMDHILNKCPQHSACVVKLDAPPLSLSLSAEDGCVCVWPMTE